MDIVCLSFRFSRNYIHFNRRRDDETPYHCLISINRKGKMVIAGGIFYDKNEISASPITVRLGECCSALFATCSSIDFLWIAEFWQGQGLFEVRALVVEAAVLCLTRKIRYRKLTSRFVRYNLKIIKKTVFPIFWGYDWHVWGYVNMVDGGVWGHIEQKIWDSYFIETSDWNNLCWKTWISFIVRG